MFLGYSLSHHGYRRFYRTMGRTYIARHVRFDEYQFPFAGDSVLGPVPSKFASSTSHPWAIV